MGVDYRVWVIPKQRSHRPDAQQVANLANALRDGQWVPRPDAPGQRSEVRELLPGDTVAWRKPSRVKQFEADPFTASWIEFHNENELVLEWYVHDMKEAGVQFPLVFLPYPDSGATYFCVRVILGHDYFSWTGENVMPFDEQLTRCACGEQLAFNAGFSAGLGHERIHMVCPHCGRNFDASEISCDILDGWSGKASPLAGGLTFRFAICVDCHKNWPHEEEALRRYHLRQEFLDLWRTHIATPFETVTTFD